MQNKNFFKYFNKHCYLIYKNLSKGNEKKRFLGNCEKKEVRAAGGTETKRTFSFNKINNKI